MSLKLRAWLLFLIFLNGYVSLSLELIVIRQLAFYVGSSAIVTSIIIGTFLGFMSLGYFKGASNKIPKSNIKDILFASFLTIALMTVLAGSFALISSYFGIMYSYGIYSIIPQTFIYSLIFLSAAPLLFGFNTALLSRYLHKYNSNYTGNIMAWDTIGSVLGSLATTLILMPFIGVNYAIIIVTALSLAAAYIAKPKPKLLVLSAIIMIPAFWINSGSFLQKEHGIIVNNANSTISVDDFPNEKVLFMNGVSMSFYNKKNRTSAEYINYINDNFIYNMPRDKKRNILVLGAGGFTAGLNDNFNNYTFIDIEKTLKDISEQKFLEEKLTPNKIFIVQDASQFLKNATINYDLIILDVYSNSYQVPEDFITAEFMQRLKNRVAENGIIIMNVICSPNFADRYTQVFDNTFHSVFDRNTQRQAVGLSNPWMENTAANVMYIYYNRENSGRIYTINKTPVIYDRK
ncbi:MAG: fused MFS/spermidine synthase [Rickettsiales bacterium]|jgi:predicted membrane-bound spermidine synthase|nr:fused MFS/spermidine synthase [Rickettsiales bacterium]